MSTSNCSLACWNSAREWIPFFGPPAVDVNKYSQDDVAYLKRVSAVGLLAIGLLAASIILNAPILFVASLTTFVLFSLAPVVEFWRGIRAADQMAADACSNTWPPPPHALAKVTICEGAAQRLIDKKDITLLNKVGLFFSLETPLSIFKAFVEAGWDFNVSNPEGDFGLKAVVSEMHPACLHFLADTKRLNPDKLTRDQQVELWCSLGYAKNGPVLKACGFDPNVQNSEGKTAETILREALLKKADTPEYRLAQLHLKHLQTILSTP